MVPKNNKSNPTPRDQINDPVYSQPVTGEPKPRSRPQSQNRSQPEPDEAGAIDDTTSSIDDDPVYSQPLTSKTTQINDPVYGQTNIAQSKPDTGQKQTTSAQGTINPLDDPVYSQPSSTTRDNSTTTQVNDDPVYGQPLPSSSLSSSSSTSSTSPPRAKGTVNPLDDPVYSQSQSPTTTRNASSRLDQISSQISPPSASEPDASVNNTKLRRNKT